MSSRDFQRLTTSILKETSKDAKMHVTLLVYFLFILILTYMYNDTYIIICLHNQPWQVPLLSVYSLISTSTCSYFVYQWGRFISGEPDDVSNSYEVQLVGAELTQLHLML